MLNEYDGLMQAGRRLLAETGTQHWPLPVGNNPGDTEALAAKTELGSLIFKLGHSQKYKGLFNLQVKFISISMQIQSISI